MMRISSPRIALAVLSLRLMGCTGVVDNPSGPDGQGPGGADGNTGGAGGEKPAGIGTAIFELCEESDKEQPGPRLLRLMTRREYRNTLRDLLFVAEPDVSSLPLESRVRGFDGISDAAAVTS